MITIRPSEERGHFNHGWLNTYHTFSFASYLDERHMGFRSLRVINEDFVAPHRGFASHNHDNMEIITYVLEGALEHKDSLGNGSVIKPHDVQRMSAGTGITHSEFNHSHDDKVHLLQIWIFPEKKGLTPSYEQKHVPAEAKLNRLRLIASPDGADDSVVIHRDVRLYASILETGTVVEHTLVEARYAWIQVTSSQILLNNQLLSAGDGASVSREVSLKIEGLEKAEFLLFDLD
ncbi:MAG: pirin family protein [Candidatus Zixiibacteriota bacterium]